MAQGFKGRSAWLGPLCFAAGSGEIGHKGGVQHDCLRPYFPPLSEHYLEQTTGLARSQSRGVWFHAMHMPAHSPSHPAGEPAQGTCRYVVSQGPKQGNMQGWKACPDSTKLRAELAGCRRGRPDWSEPEGTERACWSPLAGAPLDGRTVDG